MKRYTLGIETSCDDTSVALVDANGHVAIQLMASQIQGHTPFGGVVPEVASRLHSESLLPLIDQAIHHLPEKWNAVDLIAVTSRPGLIGSLLVGVVTAKTLSLGLKKPLIGVNHIHGHIFSSFLKDDDFQNTEIEFPYLSLVVSGGHTHIYLVESFTRILELGRTRDDAAGEAFDKFSNLLRLGFPGGPFVDRMANGGDSKAYSFPRAMLKNEGFEFSFSGLKASAARLVEKFPSPLTEEVKRNLCASFQEAICEVLIHQLAKAQKKFSIRNVSISGGVSANSRLRALAKEWCEKEGLNLSIPPIRFCTDNGAMIALTGYKQFLAGVKADQSLTPSSNSLVQDYL